MTNILEKDGPEEIAYAGRIIEMVKQPMRKGDKRIVFEWGQRAPGVRLVAIDENDRILLTKEHRYEHDDYDFRLPGGKVADTAKEWHELESAGKIEEAAKDKVIAEAKEEAGLIVEDVELIEVVPDGATFKWDLHYFETRNFKESDQELETGEDISHAWYTKQEVHELIKEKKIGEGRSVYILAPYILE